MLAATLDETQGSDATQLRPRELLHLRTLARPSGQRLRLSLRKPHAILLCRRNTAEREPDLKELVNKRHGVDDDGAELCLA